MKRIVIIGLSLTLALALVVTVAMAWGPRFGPGFGGGPPFAGAPPFANLTAEQSSQIQVLREAYLKEIAPLREELLAKGTELRSLWSTPNADPATVVAMQKEIFDLRTQLQEKATNLGLEIQKVLTPEQKAQFDRFGPRGGMGPRMGFGPGRGVGPAFSSW